MTAKLIVLSPWSRARGALLFLGLILVGCSRAATPEPVPAQFRAWGTRGPDLPALPPGWSERPSEPRLRTLPTPSRKDAARGATLRRAKHLGTSE